MNEASKVLLGEQDLHISFQKEYGCKDKYLHGN